MDLLHKMKYERYSFKGRIESAIITFKEKIWVDGTKFNLWQRIQRTINNFFDMPIR